MPDSPSPTADPFDTLLNAASDASLWVLIAGPVALLALILVMCAIWVAIRRRRDREELRIAVEQEDAPKPDTHLLSSDSRTPLGEDSGGTSRDFEPVDSTRDEKPEKRLSESKSPESFAAKAPARDAGPQEHSQITPASEQDASGTVSSDLEAKTVLLDVEDVRRTDRASWLERLKNGLAKTRASLRGGLESLFAGQVKLDQGVLERLHEVLYRADIGVATADKLVTAVRTKLGKDEAASWEKVSACLKDEARVILAAAQKPVVKPTSGPFVVLIVGVNGVGKTTTIGKLGAHFLAEDKQVLFAAADTFRAAAIEQLEVWGQRLGVDVVRHKAGSDPAAVAYDGVKAAMSRKMDVLLIDTAGRLHNKSELMAELGKVHRVVGKDLPGAPHATWLVIDATTGQNAVQQVKAFKEVASLTGLVVTKLDGTAKGGVLIGIADQFGLPIHYVGVGEKAADLRAFDVNDYVDSLF